MGRGVFLFARVPHEKAFDKVNNVSHFYTPREVAEILKVSTDTVLRKFTTMPGVIDLGSPEDRSKRQYRTLRIPREVLERFIFESRVA